LGPFGSTALASSVEQLKLLIKRGDYIRAIEVADGLKCRLESVPPEGEDRLAHALIELGSAWIELGRYDEAQEVLERALSELKELDRSRGVDTARAMVLLGRALGHLGEYRRAEEYLSEALSLLRGLFGEEDVGLAEPLDGLGVVWTHIGDYRKAARAFERALSLAERRDPWHPLVGRILCHMGEMYIDLMDYEKALPALERGVSVLTRFYGPDHPAVAPALDDLAQANESLGNFSRAELLYRRVLGIYRRSLPRNHPNVATTLNNLAVLYDYLGRYAEAQRLYRRAIEIDTEIFGPEHPEIAIELTNLAFSYAASGRYEESLDVFKRATAIQLRKVQAVLRFGSRTQKLNCLQEVSWTFEGLLTLVADHLRDDPRAVEQAANVVLSTKGIALESELLGREVIRGKLARDPRVRTLLRRLEKAGAQLADLYLRETTRASGQRSRRKLELALREVEEAEKELSRLSQDYARKRVLTDISVEDVRQMLPEDCLLLEFIRSRHINFKARIEADLYGPAHYLVIAIPAAGSGPVRLLDLGETGPVDAKIDRLRREVDRCRWGDRGGCEKVRKLSLALYQDLLQPFEGELSDCRHVVIAPDGQLNLLPFELLMRSDGGLVVQRWIVSYVTAGRDLVRLQRSRVQRAHEARLAVLIGDPDFDLCGNGGREECGVRGSPPTYFQRLGGSLKEIRAVEQVLRQKLHVKTIVYTGALATEKAVKGLTSPFILHIATHGFFWEEATGKEAKVGIYDALLKSGLALTGANCAQPRCGTGDDGILTAQEASQLNLSGTYLVFLSACETGVGLPWTGEGVIGLRRAFLEAGANSLVVSLWGLRDEDARKFACAFYQQLAAMEPVRALAETKRQVLQGELSLHDPYAWASFVLIGRP